LAEKQAFGKHPDSVRDVSRRSGTPRRLPRYPVTTTFNMETNMTWGKGALLWLLGIPLPIIILLALFWR